MTVKTRKLDVAEYLKTDEDIRVFLQEAAETCTPKEFIHALNIAARAKGMTEVASEIGVGRASLYKSLDENGNPRFETVHKLIQALGCKLMVA